MFKRELALLTVKDCSIGMSVVSRRNLTDWHGSIAYLLECAGLRKPDALSSAPTTTKSASLEILRTIAKALTGSPFSLPPEERQNALYWVNDAVGALVKRAQQRKAAPK